MHYSQGNMVGENMKRLGKLVGNTYCISLYKEYMERRLWTLNMYLYFFKFLP